MQATNKSEFMGIVSIYLVRLTIVICSPSRYSGSNSCRPVVDDNIHIPVSSNYFSVYYNTIVTLELTISIMF